MEGKITPQTKLDISALLTTITVVTSKERQIQLHFKSTGYYKIDSVFSESEIELGKSFVWEAIQKKTGLNLRTSKPKEIKKYVNKRTLYHLVDQVDERFMQFATHPNLILALTTILGPDIELMVNRHNHARLNFAGDQKVELHRDILQSTRGIVTAILYLDESLISNGCTVILPGSHNYLPDVPHTDHGGGGTWLTDYPDEFVGVVDQGLPVPVPAGGVLLFNSLVFHTIGENQTNNTRISLAFAYRANDELSTIDEPKTRLVAGERRRVGN